MCVNVGECVFVSVRVWERESVSAVRVCVCVSV